MKAEDVHHSKFPVEEIVYSCDTFVIAWGSYEEGPKRLGMRWCGDPNNPDDRGYPKRFDNPVWFMIPEELSLAFATTLLNQTGSDTEAILRVLGSLLPSPKTIPK